MWPGQPSARSLSGWAAPAPGCWRKAGSSHRCKELYRRTGGRLSLTGHAPVLLLTTAGRRTGKARTVPLLYVGDGDRLVVCNVNPGFERPNPWVLNIRAEPHAHVQLGRSTISVRARPASAEELDRYWPQLTRIWPAYQAFYDKGGERSVFVLERAPSHDPSGTPELP